MTRRSCTCLRQGYPSGFLIWRVGKTRIRLYPIYVQLSRFVGTVGRWKVTKQMVGGSGCSWPRFCWSGDSISFGSSWMEGNKETWWNMSLLPKALNSPTMSKAPTCCPVHTLLYDSIKTVIWKQLCIARSRLQRFFRSMSLIAPCFCLLVCKS